MSRTTPRSRPQESAPERQIPQAVEAEAGVLGCVLLDAANIIPEVLLRCPSSDAFYDLRHRTLWEHLVAMHGRNQPIDVITLHQRLKGAGHVEACGGLPYVASLPDGVPSAANLDYYLEIMRQKFLLRKMIQTCTEAISRAYELEPTDAGVVERFVDDIERDIASINGHQGRCDWGIKDAIKGVIRDIDSATKRSGEITGLTTGLIDLDCMTGGLFKDQMIVLAGRPGTGKSSIALNIADHLAVDCKLPVGYFSFEMSKQALLARAIGARAWVNMRYVRQGMLSDQDGDKIMKASGRLATAPLYIDDQPRQDIRQVCAKARQMVQKHGIVALVIDYLQLLHGFPNVRYRGEVEELSDISNAIKELAVELHIPVIVLSALNREIEREKKPRRPRMSDLKGCGSIESDADLIGILYRASREDRRKPAEEDDHYGESAVPVNLLICKNRDGAAADIHLTFLAAITKFECAARIANEDQPELGYSPPMKDA